VNVVSEEISSLEGVDKRADELLAKVSRLAQGLKAVRVWAQDDQETEGKITVSSHNAASVCIRYWQGAGILLQFTIREQLLLLSASHLETCCKTISWTVGAQLNKSLLVKQCSQTAQLGGGLINKRPKCKPNLNMRCTIWPHGNGELDVCHLDVFQRRGQANSV
jgi:hypothetical protein